MRPITGLGLDLVDFYEPSIFPRPMAVILSRFALPVFFVCNFYMETFHVSHNRASHKFDLLSKFRLQAIDIYHYSCYIVFLQSSY